jgi:hypothetical protein
VAASPASGVNTITGEGLAEALAGTPIVVDLANSPSFEDDAALKFFETSGRNLLAAEAAAGVGHHVALSIVGTDRLPDSGYLRAKMAQERLIKASGIPYTIVRSTQFFEFVSGIAQSATNGQTVRLSPALLQPIMSDDVADAMADATLGAPVNGTIEIAGPCPSTSSSGDFSAPSRIRVLSSPTPTRATSAPSLTIDRSRPSARRGSARPVSTTGSAIRRRSDKPAAGAVHDDDHVLQELKPCSKHHVSASPCCSALRWQPTASSCWCRLNTGTWRCPA